MLSAPEQQVIGSTSASNTGVSLNDVDIQPSSESTNIKSESTWSCAQCCLHLYPFSRTYRCSRSMEVLEPRAQGTSCDTDHMIRQKVEFSSQFEGPGGHLDSRSPDPMELSTFGVKIYRTLNLVVGCASCMDQIFLCPVFFVVYCLPELLTMRSRLVWPKKSTQIKGQNNYVQEGQASRKSEIANREASLWEGPGLKYYQQKSNSSKSSKNQDSVTSSEDFNFLYSLPCQILLFPFLFLLSITWLLNVMATGCMASFAASWEYLLCLPKSGKKRIAVPGVNEKVNPQFRAAWIVFSREIEVMVPGVDREKNIENNPNRIKINNRRTIGVYGMGTGIEQENTVTKSKDNSGSVPVNPGSAQSSSSSGLQLRKSLLGKYYRSQKFCKVPFGPIETLLCFKGRLETAIDIELRKRRREKKLENQSDSQNVINQSVVRESNFDAEVVAEVAESGPLDSQVEEKTSYVEVS